MAKEVKKIGVRLVFAWIFSILFILSGIGLLFSSPFSGVMMLLAGAIILPPATKALKSKANLEISTWLKILIVLILLVLAGVFMSSSSSENTLNNTGNSAIPDTSASGNVNYNFGERFTLGDFAYTLHDVETVQSVGNSYVGKEAAGVYLVLEVTIENLGQETTTIWSDPIVFVDDQNRVFEPDSEAWIYLSDDTNFVIEQMQPGLPKRGKMIFDVPENSKGKFRVSKSAFSSTYAYVSWN